MKKIILTFIISIMIIFMCPFNVQALGTQNEVKGSLTDDEMMKVEQLYDKMINIQNQEIFKDNELIKELNIKEYIKQYMKTGDGKVSIKKCISAVIKYGLNNLAQSMKPIGMIIIVAIICSLLNNLQQAFGNEKLSNVAYFACYSVIIILIGRSFFGEVKIAKDTINTMWEFMTALVPVLLMLLSGVGGVAEAVVMDPVILGFIGISSTIYANVIIPIIFMGFILQFVNNLTSEFKVEKLSKLFNQVAVWIQGGILTVLIGIISVRGMTSKTIDQVAVKTAKFAVDNFVPVVGKCLSDAISAVAGYSLLLKNSISSLGLVMLLMIVIYPVIRIFIMSFVFKLAAALIEPISDGKLVNCINSAGGSLVLVGSCLISISVMFYVMIAIIASAGKAIIGG